MAASPLEEDHKIYLVELTGDGDPASAKSWTVLRKLRTAIVFGFDTLIASWGSSVYSAAVEPVSQEFGVSNIVALLGLTLYICGFATGPLAFAPLSELYGRKWQVKGACSTFTCFTFAAATAKDFQTLMLTRFFSGVFASCPLAVVDGAFRDLFGNETRGITIAAFSALVFLGPFISPIVGAFITESYLAWLWTECITGIMGALAFIFDLVFLEETYLKTIPQKRAAQIRVETGHFAIHHVSEEETVDFNDLLHKHLILLLKLLFRTDCVPNHNIHSIHLRYSLFVPGSLPGGVHYLSRDTSHPRNASLHSSHRRCPNRLRNRHRVRAQIQQEIKSKQ